MLVLDVNPASFLEAHHHVHSHAELLVQAGLLGEHPIVAGLFDVHANGPDDHLGCTGQIGVVEAVPEVTIVYLQLHSEGHGFGGVIERGPARPHPFAVLHPELRLRVFNHVANAGPHVVDVQVLPGAEQGLESGSGIGLGVGGYAGLGILGFGAVFDQVNDYLLWLGRSYLFQGWLPTH